MTYDEFKELVGPLLAEEYDRSKADPQFKEYNRSDEAHQQFRPSKPFEEYDIDFEDWIYLISTRNRYEQFLEDWRSNFYEGIVWILICAQPLIWIESSVDRTLKSKQ